MPRHLKTGIISRLKGAISYFVPHSDVSATHARGVRYCVFVEGINGCFGKMNTFKEGRKYQKHIIVRRWSRNKAVHQIYTYRFPKTWSAACVANRELIKEAQRRAHALEHDCSCAAIEWHIRFFRHYFRVFKGGAKPEPGMKRYSRFYQYVYVAIYRELQREAKGEIEAVQRMKENEVDIEEISFEPVDWRPRMRSFSSPLRRAYNSLENRDLQPPDLQHIIFHRKIPRTTEEFAHVKKKQYLCTGFLISD